MERSKQKRRQFGWRVKCSKCGLVATVRRKMYEVYGGAFECPACKGKMRIISRGGAFTKGEVVLPKNTKRITGDKK